MVVARPRSSSSTARGRSARPVREASAIRPGEALHTAEVIAALVRDALVEAQGEVGEEGADRPAALVVGVAGAGQEAERKALQRILERAELADDVHVTTDAEVALADAFGEGPGILLISGTGSIAFGRGPTGTLLRCGGGDRSAGTRGAAPGSVGAR